MKTNETLRSMALAWWSNLKVREKSPIFHKYHSSGVTTLMDLTGREIEEIWKNEVQIPELRNTEHNSEYLGSQINEEDAYNNGSGLYEGKSIISKPNQKQYSQEEVDELLDRQAAESTHQTIKAMKSLNQKQFKQFDESLFKAYIDKFSDEDKLKALKVLLKSIPENVLYKDNSIPLSKRY